MLAEIARHPHARAVLVPALQPGAQPSHAYLFHGPGGAGKRAAARAVAAELLTEGVPDPDGARHRVGSGTHPDLTWVVPSGAHEILVSDVDGPVIAAASKTPFEAARRVFVIECVDQLGDEAANRMLKTLEEPASFVHLILLTDRLADVMPTICSRCQLVRFDAPPLAEVAAEMAGFGLSQQTSEAVAALALGDLTRARELAGPEGQALRAAAQQFARAAVAGEGAARRPWRDILTAVRSRGEATKAQLEGRAQADVALYPAKERKRIEAEWGERTKRSRRRVETASLDLALALIELWFCDLACATLGSGDLVRNSDRLDELEQDRGVDPQRCFAAMEVVENTRTRFVLNVSEELAMEALAYRLERVLAAPNAA